MGKDGSAYSEVEEDGTGSEISGENDLNAGAEEKLREKVADVPFGEIQRARSDGGAAFFFRTKRRPVAKRANKNRPMEVTSKNPVPIFREVIQVPKRVNRDPRFESLCGNFEESKYKSGYKFLYDEQLPAERQILQKALRTETDTGKTQAHLSWIEKQWNEEERRRKQAASTIQNKSQEKKVVKQGKKPFYFKKSEMRKEKLVEKFEELKASGNLEKYMARRRQKNAAKDHRFMPYRRINRLDKLRRIFAFKRSQHGI